MGQHAKQYSDFGAISVLGIDISEKMLEYAMKHNSAENISYRRMALEDICKIFEECQESRILEELRMKYPDEFGGTIHKPDFIFFRCRKG